MCPPCKPTNAVDKSLSHSDSAVQEEPLALQLSSSPGFRLLPPPIQGNADWRQSRALELDNGVIVLLLQDPESKATAAAACVQTGAAADPRSLPGLAHFCEHMCFLGSQKYPGENDYKQYLAQHGGHSNASTSMYTTTYKFDILADYAEHALDLFANFFIAPLFTQSGTSREVHAVDSENSKNLTADLRRRLQILKDVASKQEHYYTKFTTGHAQTLPTETPKDLEATRDALLAFHRYHYRPDRLCITVAGPQSLDQLQDWVVPRFGTIPLPYFPLDTNDMTFAEKLVYEAAQDAPPLNGNTPPPFNSPFDPYQDQQSWPFVLTIKPLVAMRQLVLQFPTPSVWHTPDQSPLSILSHLLGHEGPRSPFAVLQTAGWISSLSTGCRTSAPDFALFQISVGLTELGEQKWHDVVTLLLSYCQMLRDIINENPNDLRQIYAENAQLSRMFFHHASPQNVYDVCPDVAQNIVTYGTQHCFSAGFMLDERADTMPLERLREFVSLLVPSNCFVERCSQLAWEEAEKDGANSQLHTEQWYKIDYYTSKIDDKVVNRWEGNLTKDDNADDITSLVSQLTLPRPNRFLPRTLELCPDLPPEAKLGPRINKSIDPPNLILNHPTHRLWHRLDDRYCLPKSVFTILFRNAATMHVKKGDTNKDEVWTYDVASAMHSVLLANIFGEALAQETYDASLAGLNWHLSISTQGIIFSCNGFSDRLSDLMLKVTSEFFSNKFIEKPFFVSCRDKMVRNLETYFTSRRADAHASYYKDLLMSSDSMDLSEAVEVAKNTTIDSVKAHHQSLLANNQMLVEAFYTGNVSEQHAKETFNSLLSNFDEARCDFEPLVPPTWIPGGVQRRISTSNDIELHFASKNTQEENGAVVVAYQSPVPGYRGLSMSEEENLKSSSAVRLLCQMLHEPLFDDLRTKQALGYVVSSYYDQEVSYRAAEQYKLGPQSLPIEYLEISILSRKLSPPDILSRVDDFLLSFRSSLEEMPESEISMHASALSKKLLKPVRKLNEEASMHFNKIRRYAPEVIAANSKSSEISMPWFSSKTLANSIEQIKREDLLKTWDSLIASRRQGRIVSSVYGSTYPLNIHNGNNDVNASFIAKATARKKLIVNNLDNIIGYRNQLATFNNRKSTLNASKMLHLVASNKMLLSFAAATVVGAYALTRAKK